MYTEDSATIRNFRQLTNTLTTLTSDRFINQDVYSVNTLYVEKLTDDMRCQLAKNPIIDRICTIYPTVASDIGYTIKNNGEVIESSNVRIIEAFKHASIMSRIYGKAYLVFNPDTGGQIFKNEWAYKIYTELVKTPNGYINFKHKNKGQNNYTKKVYPLQNVLFFCHSKGYRFDEFDPENEDDYISIIDNIYKPVRDYLESLEVTRDIVKNISNLVLGVQDLSLQLRSEETKNVLFERVYLFDQAKRAGSTILKDTDESLEYINQTFNGVIDILQTLSNIIIMSTDNIPREKIMGYPQGVMGTGYYHWRDNLINVYKMLDSSLENSYLTVEFPNLNILNATEKAELEMSKLHRVEKLVDNEFLDPQMVRDDFDYWLGIS